MANSKLWNFLQFSTQTVEPAETDPEEIQENVDPDSVSAEASADDASTDKNNDEAWDFADDQKYFSEIHLAGTEQKEENGFVLKEILRTGEWPVIPTAGGVIKKPLRVVRDGESDPKNGVISLAEVVQNFEAGAIPNPQIPLSDDQKDHKNITRLNTGFVRGLSIVDKDGSSKLVAKMDFTEPDVKEKVLRGTYADVSAGIPWSVQARGKRYGSTLEHVCITNRPFIDGLGPFLAASDKGDAEVGHFGDQASQDEISTEGAQTEESKEEEPKLTFSQASDLVYKNIAQIPYAKVADYEIKDIGHNFAQIHNKTSGTTWTANFTLKDGEEEPTLELASPESWEIVQDGEKKEPSAQSGSLSNSSKADDLEEARRLRELRFSQSANNQRDEEENMPLTREELSALEMSDDARTAIQSILDEHAQLRASAREAEVDRRIDELKNLGLEERPGFLKLYRSVMLSDDGGPAVVLSDEGQEKERLTALEILDRTIEALKGSDSKVHLSDQHLASGNDEKPPATPEGEQKPLDERVAEARESIHGKK